MTDQITGVEPDEHKRHSDNAAYQAAIERAALQTSGVTTGRWKSTAQIEAEVFGREPKK